MVFKNHTGQVDHMVLMVFKNKELQMDSQVQQDQENISEMTKRIGLLIRNYEFRQRLTSKCEERRGEYSAKEVDERFTSKTCSKCRGYQEDLGDKKIYRCRNEKCRKVIDRDINASRCILLKNTI